MLLKRVCSNTLRMWAHRIHSIQIQAGEDENAALSKLKHLTSMPSTYAGLVLLFIASALISLPDMPSNSKDFLMVAFACVALLPGYKP